MKPATDYGDYDITNHSFSNLYPFQYGMKRTVVYFIVIKKEEEKNKKTENADAQAHT